MVLKSVIFHQFDRYLTLSSECHSLFILKLDLCWVTRYSVAVPLMLKISPVSAHSAHSAHSAQSLAFNKRKYLVCLGSFIHHRLHLCLNELCSSGCRPDLGLGLMRSWLVPSALDIGALNVNN